MDAMCSSVVHARMQVARAACARATCMGAMSTCTVHTPLGARQVETGLAESQGRK